MGEEEERNGTGEVDQKFGAPPSLSMPSTIVQVKTPVVLSLIPPLLSCGATLQGCKPQGCIEKIVKMPKNLEGGSIRIVPGNSNDDPWFLLPISQPPEVPSMSETNVGPCCEPCIDRRIEQKATKIKDDDIGSCPLPFSLQ